MPNDASSSAAPPDRRSAPPRSNTSPAGEAATNDDSPYTTRDGRTLLGLMTEDELGRTIGVAAPTISFWRGKGQGPPFFRFKRNIFYRTADIVQWIIENTWDPATGELIAPSPLASPSGRTRELNSGELRRDGTRAPPDPEKIIAGIDRLIDKTKRSEAPGLDPGVRSTRPQAVLDDADEDPAASVE